MDGENSGSVIPCKRRYAGYFQHQPSDLYRPIREYSQEVEHSVNGNSSIRVNSELGLSYSEEDLNDNPMLNEEELQGSSNINPKLLIAVGIVTKNNWNEHDWSDVLDCGGFKYSYKDIINFKEKMCMDMQYERKSFCSQCLMELDHVNASCLNVQCALYMKRLTSHANYRPICIERVCCASLMKLILTDMAPSIIEDHSQYHNRLHRNRRSHVNDFPAYKKIVESPLEFEGHVIVTPLAVAFDGLSIPGCRSSLWPLTFYFLEGSRHKRFTMKNLITGVIASIPGSLHSGIIDLIVGEIPSSLEEIEQGIPVYVDGVRWIFKPVVYAGALDMAAWVKAFNMYQWNAQRAQPCPKCTVACNRIGSRTSFNLDIGDGLRDLITGSSNNVFDNSMNGTNGFQGYSRFLEVMVRPSTRKELYLVSADPSGLEKTNSKPNC